MRILPNIRHGARVAVFGLALLMPAVTPLALSAQAPAGIHDGRWQPWLGCWSPTGTLTPMQTVGVETIGSPTRSLLCVVPGPSPTSVEVVNFSGGTIVERTVVEPGRPTTKTVDECTGTETATWSRDGRRVLLSGRFTCGQGVTRVESGIMSIDPAGEWVQAQSVNVNGNINTFVAHFRESGIALEGIRDGAIVERPILDATGQRLSPPRDACTGSDDVSTSPDGTRMTVRSSYTCAGGLKRVADAEFVKTANGAWTRSGGPGVPFATASVRAAAGADIQTDDVLEVAKAVEPVVAEAWLSDRGQGFSLSGKELIRLADAGLSPRVLDVMVAVSNPRTFTFRRPGGEAMSATEPAFAENLRQAPDRSMGCGFVQSQCFGMMGLGWMYGADAYYGWGPFGAPFSRFGYGGLGGWGGGWGWGNGFWGPGYFSGPGPVVVIGNPGTTAPRGRAVFGQGYTRDRSGTGTDRPITFSSPMSGSSSGGGGVPSSGSSGSSGGGGGGAARTAKPRGGGE